MSWDHSPKTSRPLIGLRSALFAAACFFSTLIAFMPVTVLGHFIDSSDLNISYQSAHGTIWHGMYKNVAIDGVPFGDVSFSVVPISLIAFNPALDLTLAGGALRGQTRMQLNRRNRIRFIQSVGEVDLNWFASRGIMGVEVSGATAFNFNRIEFAGSDCVDASGEFITEILNEPAKRFQGTDFPMKGTIECVGRDWNILMAGESNAGKVEIDLTIHPDKTYILSAFAAPQRDDLEPALLFFGFEKINGAYQYGSTGRFDGVGT